MNTDFVKKITVIVLSIALLASIGFLGYTWYKDSGSTTSQLKKSAASNSDSSGSASGDKEQLISTAGRKGKKSKNEKKATLAADQDLNDSYGLSYDYVNMTLPEVVQAYLDEQGIPHDSVAFSYKNTATGELIEMNETQPMTAGSTYKLPLNMLVVDEVDKGKYNLTQAFDITNTYYEYQGEHDTYVAAFGGEMTIPQMQEYSLVFSENTPAYALADRLGGMDKARSMFNRYGESKAELKTFSDKNKTTTNYYIQVLDYLWKHKDKYKDLRKFIGESFEGEYAKGLLSNIYIEQKPGYVGEALNVDAIMYEETPYLVAVYTAGLGGTTPESTEVSGAGLYQLSQIVYVINEWHRVNMN